MSSDLNSVESTMTNQQLLVDEALLTVVIGTLERLVSSMCCY